MSGYQVDQNITWEVGVISAKNIEMLESPCQVLIRCELVCRMKNMPKYRDYCRQMLEKHEKEFAVFAEVHARYQLDRSAWQDDFNEKGRVVVDIIREWEGRLCGHSEKGQFAKFSSTLAEKFWGEIKAYFPLIDLVGVIVKKPEKTKLLKPLEFEKKEPVFVINNLNEEQDPDLKEIDDFQPDDFVLKKLF